MEIRYGKERQGHIMSRKFHQYYLNVAKETAKLSYANRLKVGAVLVKDNNIISSGYNGTPTGKSNECETTQEDGSLVTKPEVLHAEENCIGKVAASTQSSKGATLYLTHPPCIRCAKLIHSAQIEEVWYAEEYVNGNDEGKEFLISVGVSVFTPKQLWSDYDNQN